MRLFKDHIPAFRQIRKTLTQLDTPDITTKDLNGACAISAYYTTKYLQNRGEPANLNYVVGWHWFTECRGYIIDLTATQFGIKDKILIEEYGLFTEKVSKKCSFIFKSPVRTATLDRFRRIMAGWPDGQNPFKLKRSVNKELILGLEKLVS